jgi:pilus assembly protein CpaF/type IV secretion system protein VirB11
MSFENGVHPALDALLEPIKPYLNTRDQRVVDVMINEPGSLWLQIAGQPGYKREGSREITLDWAKLLCQTLANVLGRAFTDDLPILLAPLPGGHRFTALLGPNVQSGILVSIRVRRSVAVPIDKFGTWSKDGHHQPVQVSTTVRPDDPVEALRQAILAKDNILVSGGTCTGKTTFLNGVATWIPPTDRVITVEDVNEVMLPQVPNRAHVLVSRTDAATKISYSHVIDSILRFNPDRIVLGELSVHNALPSARLLNTGHGGFIATVHANSPLEALEAWRRNYELSPDSGRNSGETVVRFLARNLAHIVQINLDHERHGRVMSIASRGPDGTLDLPWRDLI